MVNVRARPDTGQLFLDFRYRGVRCREQTALDNTAENRKRVEALAKRIKKETANGTFEYAAHFPNSPRADEFAEGAPPPTLASPRPVVPQAASPVAQLLLTTLSVDRHTPSFSDFAELWFLEMLPTWRAAHRQCVRDVLNKNLLPTFGHRAVHSVCKADVLGFRAVLAQQPGRKASTLGAARINKVMCFLRQILNEAADRFEFTPAFRSVKPLKQKRTDVQPFTFDEVRRILENVRPDFRDYVQVRFFTGMRTGEINGLKWKHIDLERRLILVRESVVNGEESDGLKNETSARDIEMLPMVWEAIQNRLKVKHADCPWVFSTSEGSAINANNFCNRLWYPLLRYLELDKRRPYQTRHTAATLMLAAGENPEWIAKVMGHASVEMLFKVYSRFVPNLTRRDGQAFAGLVHSRMGQTPATPDMTATLAALNALPPEQLAALLAQAQRPAA